MIWINGGKIESQNENVQQFNKLKKYRSNDQMIERQKARETKIKKVKKL